MSLPLLNHTQLGKRSDDLAATAFTRKPVERGPKVKRPVVEREAVGTWRGRVGKTQQDRLPVGNRKRVAEWQSRIDKQKNTVEDGEVAA